MINQKRKKIEDREKIDLDESFDDQTAGGPWEYRGEIYEKVDEIKEFGDGEEHNVIVRRRSDGSYFTFCWCYFHSMGDYEFDNRMIEVFLKETVTYE